MAERLVHVDMIGNDGLLWGSGEMEMNVYFFEDGFRQQIVDRQTFCKEGWQGKLDVRVKELTKEHIEASGLKAVIVPSELFRGMVKRDPAES